MSTNVAVIFICLFFYLLAFIQCNNRFFIFQYAKCSLWHVLSWTINDYMPDILITYPIILVQGRICAEEYFEKFSCPRDIVYKMTWVFEKSSTYSGKYNHKNQNYSTTLLYHRAPLYTARNTAWDSYNPLSRALIFHTSTCFFDGMAYKLPFSTNNQEYTTPTRTTTDTRI